MGVEGEMMALRKTECDTSGRIRTSPKRFNKYGNENSIFLFASWLAIVDGYTVISLGFPLFYEP